jgi:two-component system response regulator MprA
LAASGDRLARTGRRIGGRHTNDRGSHLARQGSREHRRSRVLLSRQTARLEGLARFLDVSGFKVETVRGGHDVVRRLEHGRDFDAVVVELPQRRRPAVELTERLRRADDDVAMIALLDSAPGDVRIAVLEAGADDVLDMPLMPLELSARIRAVLRRTAASPRDETVLQFGELELDLVSRRGRRGANEFEATPTEFDLLELLLRNPQRVLPRSLIFERVWGYDIEYTSNSLDVYIGVLRRKTEAGGATRMIQTVRGVGFVLRES